MDASKAKNIASLDFQGKTQIIQTKCIKNNLLQIKWGYMDNIYTRLCTKNMF